MDLRCHPHARTDAVQAVSAVVARVPQARLRITFVLAGDLAGLRVPLFRELRAGADLWRHTCFEVFVGVDGATVYHELNLAPSGEWAVLGFRRYRDGEPLAGVPPPRVSVATTSHRLALEADIALASLSPSYASAPLRVALATVVEDTSGALSYWALHHPPGDPDFHHGDAFVLRLEPPAVAC